MKVSLRKANALQQVIQEQIGEQFVGEVTVGKFDNAGEVIEEATKKLTETIDKKFDLIGVLFSIRQKVGAAGASAGINDLLTDLAKIEKQVAFLKQLASTRTFAPKLETVEKSLAELREQPKGESRSYYGVKESVNVSLLDKATVDGYSKLINTARKEKNKISDKLLHLNVSTEIELDEQEVSVLNKYDIL